MVLKEFVGLGSLKGMGLLKVLGRLKGMGRWLAIALLCVFASGCAGSALMGEEGPYYYKSVASEDATGKVYMGREIAQVMGHQGAYWLERSSREWEEKPGWVIAGLDLQPDEVVADIGAGTGYLSFRMAERVPEGQVFAVDVEEEMVDILTEIGAEKGGENVVPVLSSETEVGLPVESVDVAVMVDAYHEFAYPYEVMESLTHALKPDGRVVLVEYRGENPFVAIKPHHKMRQSQVKREMQAVGLVWQETKDFLPQQHFMVFRCAPMVCGVGDEMDWDVIPEVPIVETEDSVES